MIMVTSSLGLQITLLKEKERVLYIENNPEYKAIGHIIDKLISLKAFEEGLWE
jgi:hypothetical protein